MTVNALRPVVDSEYALLLAHEVVSSSSEGDFGNRRAVIKNVTGTAGVYLGGPDTAVGDRFLWESEDGSLSVDLEPGEALWGISDGADQTLHILVNGR